MFSIEGFEDLPPLLTVDEVANYLKVHRHTVIRWIHSGVLRAAKVGRAYRIEKSQVRLILEAGLDASGTGEWRKS